MNNNNKMMKDTKNKKTHNNMYNMKKIMII